MRCRATTVSKMRVDHGKAMDNSGNGGRMVYMMAFV